MNTSFSKIPDTNIRARILITLILLFIVRSAIAQEITITCNNEPLNKILITLRDTYGIMVSFDDKQLSGYRLTVDRKFSSLEEAFDYLFEGLPLDYEITEGVYVIYSVRKQVVQKKYSLAGRILDRTNHETLPFSSILINKAGLISDAKGFFSYTSHTDSIFHVEIFYLGYYILDTIVSPGTNYVFHLIPSVIALEEIVIEGSEIARSIQTGSSPGISRINHKIAYFLPGDGDNSIFNLLRLQPGILASGEQSADYFIWGSYQGQSQVIFDGFTLYGMKNFNDNISAVNPFMAKDIKVLKGGYGAEYGERVGGIIDITGIDGNRLSPSVQFCINNMTLNGILSVPLQHKSALVLAYRQTYYDLYDDLELPSLSGSGRGRNSREVDHYIQPDYRFRDANIKFSGSGSKSNYSLSLYRGRDNFSYSFDQENQQRTINLDYSEGNVQLGAAASYGLTWKEKNTSDLTVSYSALETDRDQFEEIERHAGNQSPTSIDEQYTIAVQEMNTRIDNKINITEVHALDAGAGLMYYFTSRQKVMAQLTAPEENTSLPLPYLYVQDNISLLKKLTLRPGIHADFLINSEKLYTQPRFSIVYSINESFRVNSAMGLYNQFVAKNMTIDTSGNYSSSWSICDGNEIPVLNSLSYSLGLSYNKNDYTFSIEGYYKHTEGIARYLNTTDRMNLYTGDSKTRGLDFFIKIEFRSQTFWISYTLSKTEEYFSYFPDNDYIPAMHDQRHELKLAALAKIRSFHISTNFVYGSGFPDPEQLPFVIDYMKPYSRWDAAVIYKFSTRKIHLDAGLSVLNILNTENIKYSNYTTIPTDATTSVSIYAEAVPFRPALFLHLYY
jgi:outer membrane receptor protein involved in Fe transport